MRYKSINIEPRDIDMTLPCLKFMIHTLYEIHISLSLDF